MNYKQLASFQSPFLEVPQELEVDFWIYSLQSSCEGLSDIHTVDHQIISDFEEKSQAEVKSFQAGKFCNHIPQCLVDIIINDNWRCTNLNMLQLWAG